MLGNIQEIKELIALNGRNGILLGNIKDKFNLSEVQFKILDMVLQKNSNFIYVNSSESDRTKIHVMASTAEMNNALGIVNIDEIPTEPAYSLLELIGSRGARGVTAPEASQILNIKTVPFDKLVLLGLVIKRVLIPDSKAKSKSQRVQSRVTIFHLKKFEHQYNPAEDNAYFEKNCDEMEEILRYMESILSIMRVQFMPATDMAKYMGIDNRQMQYLRTRFSTPAVLRGTSNNSNKIPLKNLSFFMAENCFPLSTDLSQSAKERTVWCFGVKPCNTSDHISSSASSLVDFYAKHVDDDSVDGLSALERGKFGTGLFHKMSIIEQCAIHASLAVQNGISSNKLYPLFGAGRKRTMRIALDLVNIYGLNSLKTQEGKTTMYKIFSDRGIQLKNSYSNDGIVNQIQPASSVIDPISPVLPEISKSGGKRKRSSDSATGCGAIGIPNVTSENLMCIDSPASSDRVGLPSVSEALTPLDYNNLEDFGIRTPDVEIINEFVHSETGYSYSVVHKECNKDDSPEDLNDNDKPRKKIRKLNTGANVRTVEFSERVNFIIEYLRAHNGIEEFRNIRSEIEVKEANEGKKYSVDIKSVERLIDSLAERGIVDIVRIKLPLAVVRKNLNVVRLRNKGESANISVELAFQFIKKFNEEPKKNSRKSDIFEGLEDEFAVPESKPVVKNKRKILREALLPTFFAPECLEAKDEKFYFNREAVDFSIDRMFSTSSSEDNVAKNVIGFLGGLCSSNIVHSSLELLKYIVCNNAVELFSASSIMSIVGSFRFLLKNCGLPKLLSGLFVLKTISGRKDDHEKFDILPADIEFIKCLRLDVSRDEDDLNLSASTALSRLRNINEAPDELKYQKSFDLVSALKFFFEPMIEKQLLFLVSVGLLDYAEGEKRNETRKEFGVQMSKCLVDECDLEGITIELGSGGSFSLNPLVLEKLSNCKSFSEISSALISLYDSEVMQPMKIVLDELNEGIVSLDSRAKETVCYTVWKEGLRHSENANLMKSAVLLSYTAPFSSRAAKSDRIEWMRRVISGFYREQNAKGTTRRENFVSGMRNNAQDCGDIDKYTDGWYSDDEGLSLGDDNAEYFDSTLWTLTQDAVMLKEWLRLIFINRTSGKMSTLLKGRDDIVADEQSTAQTLFKLGFTTPVTSFLYDDYVLALKEDCMNYLFPFDEGDLRSLLSFSLNYCSTNSKLLNYFSRSSLTRMINSFPIEKRMKLSSRFTRFVSNRLQFLLTFKFQNIFEVVKFVEFKSGLEYSNSGVFKCTDALFQPLLNHSYPASLIGSLDLPAVTLYWAVFAKLLQCYLMISELIVSSLDSAVLTREIKSRLEGIVQPYIYLCEDNAETEFSLPADLRVDLEIEVYQKVFNIVILDMLNTNVVVVDVGFNSKYGHLYRLNGFSNSSLVCRNNYNVGSSIWRKLNCQLASEFCSILERKSFERQSDFTNQVFPKTMNMSMRSSILELNSKLYSYSVHSNSVFRINNLENQLEVDDNDELLDHDLSCVEFSMGADLNLSDLFNLSAKTPNDEGEILVYTSENIHYSSKYSGSFSKCETNVTLKVISSGCSGEIFPEEKGCPWLDSYSGKRIYSIFIALSGKICAALSHMPGLTVHSLLLELPLILSTQQLLVLLKAMLNYGWLITSDRKALNKDSPIFLGNM